jgi:hypothetical protein
MNRKNAPSPGTLDNLFDDAGAAAPAVPAADEVPELKLGVPWPKPWPIDWCRAALQALQRKENVPAGPEGGEAIARVVAGRLTVAEHSAAENGTSPMAEALVARIALAGAVADGEKLAAAGTPVLVDAGAVASLAEHANTASEQLQQEANRVVAKGDPEALRLLRTAHGALSQELHAFKKMADRLRGPGLPDFLGLGRLDPDVQVEAQTRSRRRGAAGPPQTAMKSEVAAFDQTPRPRRTGLWLAVSASLFAAGLANAFYFSRTRPREVSAAQVERAGQGVVSIVVSEKSALVRVTPQWAEHTKENAGTLTAALAAMRIERAMVEVQDGRPLGGLDLIKGRAFLTTLQAADPLTGPPVVESQPSKAGGR